MSLLDWFEKGAVHLNPTWKPYQEIWPELLSAVALVTLGFGLKIGLGPTPAAVSVAPRNHYQRSAKSPPRTGDPPTTTSSTTTSTTTTTPPLSEPGGGNLLLPGRRIVAFYGAPGGGTLGVLGQNSPEEMWPKLLSQAAPYAQPGVSILPAYELITYVAQGSPGPNGTYSARLSDAVITQYLNVVQQHQGLLILDIQPGRGNFLSDAKTLTPFLKLPDVALALDPEWQLGPNQLPAKVIGSTTASDINQVSNWLEQLVEANKLPQKLLLIHQFTSSMIQDKSAVVAQPNLAIVFNMDGFGGWKAKIATYKMIGQDTQFPLGFKLFYSQDTPLKPPSSVLALSPQPVIIEYE